MMELTQSQLRAHPRELAINHQRLRHELTELARFGATADGGVTRCAFSSAERDARQWLARRCEEAGLRAREDAVGNLFIRLDGPPGPPVWTGSHLDTVPRGGRLDGALGVIAAVEVLRRLKEEAIPLTRPVEAVAFADEEGTFYGHLGSRALIRNFEHEELSEIYGPNGISLIDALAGFALDSSSLAQTALAPGSVYAFVELHIEQGPQLEAEGSSIGVVTHFVGVGRGIVLFAGRADHAGTTPMTLRRDALLGAADFLTELPGLPRRVRRPAAVVTCGRLEIVPGARNVVPGEVAIYLDFRDEQRDGLDALERSIIDVANRCADRHCLNVVYQPETITDPVPLSDEIPALVAEVATALGISTRRMHSGASHDAQIISALAPVGMIFVPSKGGRSHSPLEDTSWEDIGRGAQVLLGVVQRLATAATTTIGPTRSSFP
jgi:beta-ureidopropionase / N-carbamoyl-L-amino-acid hydrolase